MQKEGIFFSLPMNQKLSARNGRQSAEEANPPRFLNKPHNGNFLAK